MILVLCLNKDWKSIKTLKAKKWFKILNNNFVVFESKKLFENQVPAWINNYIKFKSKWVPLLLSTNDFLNYNIRTWVF